MAIKKFYRTFTIVDFFIQYITSDVDFNTAPNLPIAQQQFLMGWRKPTKISPHNARQNRR